MRRRNFFRKVIVGGTSLMVVPVVRAFPAVLIPETNIATPSAITMQGKPETNIATARAIPRTADSMPGKYPGKVVTVRHSDCVADGKPSEPAVYEMLKSCMIRLSGESDLKKAWLQFVSPQDVIGIKVNPIGGKLLSTSHAVTKSIIRQLVEAGISEERIIIWDRRKESLEDAGFSEENYPGIQMMSTEWYDENNSYVNSEGRFYSEDRIDRNQYYYADVEGEYDADTMPYMVNGGKNSYFTKICTEKVTKIINVPVLKNAGVSITCCMKNLAFGAITNTGRLHQDLWHETCAEVCAFPPLRDKVVLNIVDAIIGCFDGGPAANPQFICQYDTLLAGTDPVAVDSIAFNMVLQKRIAEGIQQEEREGARRFMEIAQELGLGVTDKIECDSESIKVVIETNTHINF